MHIFQAPFTHFMRCNPSKKITLFEYFINKFLIFILYLFIFIIKARFK